MSGAMALDRRPGLLAALDCMADHHAGLLVATKRDRCTRAVILAAQLERLVERDGAELVSADGASEGNSPEAMMMRRILDILAHSSGTLSAPAPAQRWRSSAQRV